MKFKFLFGLLAIGYALLAIYSFSQIDLNLTLSSNVAYQAFQKQLILLGYFNRPLSTAIYIGLTFLLFTSYLLLIKFVKNQIVSLKQLWFAIIVCVIILIPSYPAFSHDIFNYMFDARIVTKYGLSPWQYKALNFPADTWTRFMRWTHRPSVYPPVWIGLSLLPSVLGLDKFTFTLLLFKLMAAGFYLGSCYLILQLSKALKQPNPLLHLALFAFNPLVIIETLVNGHMEIVMAFFALLALYLSLQSKALLSWLSLIASMGIKFMTLYLAPLLVKGQSWLRRTIWFGLILTIAWIIYYGFQPWYILWVLPFVYLLPLDFWEIKIMTLLSFTALFWNLPLISSGDFNLPNPTTSLFYYVFIPFMLLMLLYFSFNLIKPKHAISHD